MEALIPILIGVAAKVGAPIVKGILEKHVGPLAGSVAGDVIDAVAKNAGVDISTASPDALGAAVAATESETPEILAQWVASQKLANDLQLAEMAKDETWTWAWRPAWMWLLAFLWTYALVLRPLVNASLGASIEGLDLSLLMTLTGAYLALYMGGHTIKDVFGRSK